MNSVVDVLPPGTQLGQYRLEEVASRGGFGILYRAWDEELKRMVAVKECFPDSICRRNPETGMVEPRAEALRQQYETAQHDVLVEAQMLAGLHHARVVPVYDIIRTGSGVFYVMPWLEGGSLRDRLEAGEPVSRAEAVRWLLELLPALEYLHERQITHRDLKPANIMFDAQGNSVLVDFGAALNRATKTDTTTQGDFSQAYASPEQVSGKGKMGPWTDLYSLAATWYEILSGAAPEPAQQRLVQDDLQLLPPGPTVLEESIMQNLALAPELRCQSAREWLEWLQRGSAPVAVARHRRNHFLWALPLVLLGAVGVYYLGRQQSVPVAETVALAEPALAEPAGEAIVVTEEFYNEVCGKLGLHQRMEMLRKAMLALQEMDAMNRAAVDQILAKMKTQASHVETHEDVDAMYQLQDGVLRPLRLAWGAEVSNLQKQIVIIQSEFQNDLNDLPAAYPWKTQQEFMQLKQLEPRLRTEFLGEISKILNDLNKYAQNQATYGELEAAEIVNAL